MKHSQDKPGRNAPCPCGSGMKYKKCCGQKDAAAAETLAAQYLRKHGIRLKGPQDVAAIRRAGRLAMATLDMVEAMLAPGITTDHINALVHEFTLAHNAVPAPLHYKGFPKSVCTSINEVICHGIPSNRVLEDGDIINVDVTPILDGYFADANKTFFIGTPGSPARQIVAAASACLQAGLAAVKPGGHIGDIGWAIEQCAAAHGCSVVREFVGHGVGFAFHEPPQIPHFGRKGQGICLVPGMVFTIEPMINLGERHLHVLDDGWTAVTNDGSLSAQFEQTVLVTADGMESLTPF
jgi:methionyl aminopeptidase